MRGCIVLPRRCVHGGEKGPLFSGVQDRAEGLIFSSVLIAKGFGRMEENIGSLDVELSKHDLEEIEAAAAKLTIQGDRYPAHFEALTNR